MLSLFSFSMFLGQETWEGGKVSFLSPEIGLACPASSPNGRTKADKMWFVAWKVGGRRVFARYSMEGRKTALTF